MSSPLFLCRRKETRTSPRPSAGVKVSSEGPACQVRIVTLDNPNHGPIFLHAVQFP
ncbi:hypothetical protein THTE_2984 [Thermogutta terrifontis]|uniref:Uncharacterized protein n=1 Tax=Thermogutta terrifontis TaxID=1331910 RepID=A0A286RI21_9BACT|nr:hypothetical protein THTE_2984 [Thermogutta terrifontis]